MATVYAGVHFKMVEERRRIEERREKGNLAVRRVSAKLRASRRRSIVVVEAAGLPNSGGAFSEPFPESGGRGMICV